MSLNLYELSNEYLEFLNLITDPNEELDKQTVADTLESLDCALDEKLLNTARVIVSLEAEAEAVESVELRLRHRRQSLENKSAWLRDYLTTNLHALGKDALKANDIAIKLAKLPQSVIVTDESLIPDTLWRSTTTRVPDKASIKQLGGCPGVVIESKGYRVSIK